MWGVKYSDQQTQRRRQQQQQQDGSRLSQTSLPSSASRKHDSTSGPRSASILGSPKKDRDRSSLSNARRRFSMSRNSMSRGEMSPSSPGTSSAVSPTGTGTEACSSSTSDLPPAGNVDNDRVLMAATIERWIAEMTSKIESHLMTDFFLTYRAFVSSLVLCQLLLARFEWALQGSPGDSASDLAGRRIVRVRTYVVVRHWLLNYFHEDFVPNRELRLLLTAWLNRMGKDDRLRANPSDLRLIKSLKKVVKKLKAAYSTIGPEEAAGATVIVANTSTTSVDKTQIQQQHHSLSNSQQAATKASTGYGGARQAAAEVPQHIGRTDLEDLGNTASGACNGASRASRTLCKSSESRPTTPPSTASVRDASIDPRASSSEDDVDLDIDIHPSGYDSDERPRLPPIIPISPPRTRHQSPRTLSAGRSPRRISRTYSANHSLTASPNKLVTLPPISDGNNRFSRYISSTVGSIGKLRRMVNTNRPTAFTDPDDHFRADSNEDRRSVSASDDQSNGPDLLFSGRDQVQHDEVTHQRRHVSRDDDNNGSRSAAALRPGLGIFNLTTGVDDGPGAQINPQRQTLQHAKSNQTLRSQQEASSTSLLAPPVELESPMLQLDDLDSSDDESDYGGTADIVRTIRRLPAARDLRLAGEGGKRMAQRARLLHRHSIDTISSYGTRRTPSFIAEPMHIPSFDHYESDGESTTFSLVEYGQDGGPTGIVQGQDQGVVPFFVPLAESDDDDDEPGDVEAALRRLEGQVDQDRQKSKAKKVEEYLKLSEEAKLGSHGASRGWREEHPETKPSGTPPAEPVATNDVSSVGLQDSSKIPTSDTLPISRDAPTSEYGRTDLRQSTLNVPSIEFPQVAESSIESRNAPTSPAPNASPRIKRKSSIMAFFDVTRASALLRSKPSPQQGRDASVAAANVTPTLNRAKSIVGHSGITLPVHRSFVLDVRTDTLAKHFCIIERDLLDKITWQELVSGEWRDRDGIVGEVTDWDLYLKQRARLNAKYLQEGHVVDGPFGARVKKVGDVQTIIQRFNIVCNWVASESESDP